MRFVYKYSARYCFPEFCLTNVTLLIAFFSVFTCFRVLLVYQMKLSLPILLHLSAPGKFKVKKLSVVKHPVRVMSF